jgi:MFS family permease
MQKDQKANSYGYVIAAACFSIQAIGVGIYVAYGVFFNPLITEFGWSRTVISSASSLAFLIMGIFGIFVGRFNDRFGPKKLMAITAVFLGTGCMLMSRLTAVWQLYLFYGIIFGIGLSSVDVIAMSTIARWFARKRGMMTGIVKVGTGAGQFTLPLVASALISIYGWRNAYLIIGVTAMVALVLIAQLLRRDPGQIEVSVDIKNSAQKVKKKSLAVNLTLEEALLTVQLWIICIVNLTLLFCLMSIMVHIVPHARDIGVSAPRAAGVLSTIGGVSMLGRFVSGMAVDRIGSKQVMIICFFLLIVGLLWLQTADTLWMLLLFACIYGIAHGGFFTAISPIVAELFGIKSHGALFGIVVCFGAIGGAAGPIMAGYIFDMTDSYSLYFWLITLMGSISLGLMFLIRPVQVEDIRRF